MPFSDERTMGALTVIRNPELEPVLPPPDFVTETAPAFLRNEHWIGSALSRGRMPQPGVQTPEYNPFKRIEGTHLEAFAEQFVDVDNDDDFDLVKYHIERQMQDYDTLSRAPGTQVAGMMALGMLDPLILLPMGAGYRAAKAGILSRGLLTARAGMFGSTVNEALLHSSQDVRTFGQSAANVAAATLLSGVMGGTAEAFHLGASAARATHRSTEPADVLATRLMAEAEEVVQRELGGIDEELLAHGGFVAGASGATVTGPYTPAPGAARAPGPFMPRSSPPLATPTAPASTQNFRPVKAWKGLEKYLTKLSPLARILQTSESEIARDAVVRMRAPPFFVETAEALKAAVHDRVLAGQSGLARYLQESRAAWVEYRFGRTEGTLDREVMSTQIREGITGKRTDPLKMTYREFREEQGIASDAGDVHAVPQVQRATKSLRENVLTPNLQRGVDVGVFDPAILTAKPLGASGYFPRMWRRRADASPNAMAGKNISAHRNDLADRLHQDFASRPTAEGMEPVTPEQLRKLTDDALDKIIGINPERIDMDAFHATIAKSTKHREIPIANVLVNDFLEKDAEKVARAYVHSVLPEIEMRAEFGEEGFEKVLKDVNDEYQARMANTPDGPEMAALTENRRKTLDDLQTMHDMTMGIYGTPPDPDAWLSRAGLFMKRFNFATMGGGFGMNSVADIGNIVMARGVTRTFDQSIKAMRADFKGFQIEANRAGELAGVWEVVLNSRVNAIADISADTLGHTQAEHAMGTIANSMSFVNLQAPWNQYAKSVVALTGMGSYREMVTTARAGAISRKVQLELDRAGIEWRGAGNMASRIADEMDAHGKDFEGIFIAETADWTDREAAEALRVALTRDVNRIVVSPGPGDLPSWLPTEMGRLLGQFKQFQFATTMNIVLPNLQAVDRNTINGIMVGVGAGMIVYMLRTIQGGRTPSLNPLVLAREGIDRSGALGIIFEPYNILERSIGVNPLGFAAPSSRYGQVSPVGAVFGPTVGTLNNAATALNAALTFHWTDADVRAARRLVPYQNVFYLDKGFDAIEAASRALLVSERTQ